MAFHQAGTIITAQTPASSAMVPLVHRRIQKVHLLKAPSRCTASISVGRLVQTDELSVWVGPLGYHQLAVVAGNGVPSPGAIVTVGTSTAGPGTAAVPTWAVAADLGGMTQCAAENPTSTVNGTQTVLFGANGTYASRTVTNAVICNAGPFGDPVSGVVKACYVASSGR